MSILPFDQNCKLFRFSLAPAAAARAESMGLRLGWFSLRACPHTRPFMRKIRFPRNCVFSKIALNRVLRLRRHRRHNQNYGFRKYSIFHYARTLEIYHSSPMSYIALNQTSYVLDTKVRRQVLFDNRVFA